MASTPTPARPYVWFGKSLVDIPHAELPHIDAEQARQLVDDIVELLIREHGYTLAKPLQKKLNGEADSHGDGLDWAALTANILKGEGLHDATRDLAATWVGAGIPAKHALRQLRALMLASPGPRDERWQARLDDLARVVRDVEAKFGSAAPTTTLEFADMSAWDLTAPPARDWWLQDRFPLRQTTLLSGEGAVGKSILLLQFLVATVLNTRWLDIFTPASGPVLYLGAEDEEDEIRRRLAAILDHHGRKFADLIEGGFKMLALAGKDAALAEFDQRGRIKPTPLFKQLYEQAHTLQPKGLVLDPVSDVFLGDEINRAQVRQFGSLLRKVAIDCNCGLIIA